MELDLVSLEGSAALSGLFFGVSVGLVWLWASCLLVLSAVFLLCWIISMGYLALELVDSLLEFGFSVGTEAFE